MTTKALPQKGSTIDASLTTTLMIQSRAKAAAAAMAVASRMEITGRVSHGWSDDADGAWCVVRGANRSSPGRSAHPQA